MEPLQMDRENTPPHLTGKSLYLPQEIIEEILPRLAAKSLLRLRCVSKSWRCLIDSERFIKAHLKKSIEDPSYAHWRLLFDSKFGRNIFTQCSMESYILDNHHAYIHRRPFDDSTNNHLTTKDCDVVGHCNGLLCIKKGECFFLCNPTTRISIELPKLTSYFGYIQKYGFGMDEHSGAYKVFVVLNNEDVVKTVEYICKVYSSETKSWKTVEQLGGLDVSLHVEDEAGVLVGGKLYWLRDREIVEFDVFLGGCLYLDSFDLSSEVFEMIELPYKKGEGEGWCGCDDNLGVTRGMLRVTLNYYKDGEEMKDEWVRVRVTEGGVKEHWVKVDTERDGETKNIIDYCRETVYVESLVWPVSLKNH